VWREYCMSGLGKLLDLLPERLRFDIVIELH
jgi:hypothetical protein